MASSSDPSHYNAGSRPEELPPVSPPSAGFIVQLFLIPALIVMAVVAVWALFGKLADSESDWTQLVAELGSSNEHRRWRAALGLAQLMKNDEVAPPTDREPLSTNPAVVDSLVKLLSESLAASTPTQEDITHQEFLARTLSVLEDDEKTLPVLAEAMKDSHDIEVRKSALMAVATIAGRHFDRQTGYSEHATPAGKPRIPLENPTITNEAILEALRQSAQSPEPVLRHLAGFAIANVGGPDAIAQLKVMLLDGDRFARANAALGLARNGSTAGVPALKELITESLKPFDQKTVADKTQAEQLLAENSFEVEEPKVVRNSLHALQELWPQIEPAEQAELLDLIRLVSTDFFAPDVRIQASELLKELEMHPDRG
jgi:HEAT repeat protein